MTGYVNIEISSTYLSPPKEIGCDKAIQIGC